MEALLNLPLSKAAPGDVTAPQYDEKCVHTTTITVTITTTTPFTTTTTT